MAGAEILDEMSMLSPCSRHIYSKIVHINHIFLGIVLGLRGVNFRGGQVIHQSPVADDYRHCKTPLQVRHGLKCSALAELVRMLICGIRDSMASHILASNQIPSGELTVCY